MKQVIVGTYEMGYEKVQLVLREGDGAEFYVLPGDIHCPRIKIGADVTEWRDLLTSFFHEVAELAFVRTGLRYAPSEELGRDHGSYAFFMGHPQFSEACGRVADFSATALPALWKAWNKWKKGKK